MLYDDEMEMRKAAHDDATRAAFHFGWSPDVRDEMAAFLTRAADARRRAARLTPPPVADLPAEQTADDADDWCPYPTF